MSINPIKAGALAACLVAVGGVAGWTQTMAKPAPIDVVHDYLALAFGQHHIREAVLKYLSDDFKQHSPHIADGREALIQHLEAEDKQGETSTAARTLVDGELVAIHHHVQMGPNDPGRAQVDIFRVDHGKIVEHWDVTQPVPAKALNDNGMF